MPNYSDTVIYKIVCLDPTITEVYVGSTTNFHHRKLEHKNICCNENHQNYNLKIYTTIRENGGIDNWEMIEIESYPCENDEQKRERERYWYDVLKPSMNTHLPLQTKEERIEEIKEYHKTENYKQYQKEYREKNYENNKEYQREYQREYYKTEKKREYNEKNKEKLNEYQREYNEKNKERIKEYRREYIKKKKALTP